MPTTVNFDLWCGPAPKGPLLRKQLHYEWHWFWATGNGEMGNNGIHIVDIARWAMNKELPVKVSSAGGRFGYKDQAQTPNTQTSQFTYADGTLLTFEVRNLAALVAEKNLRIADHTFFYELLREQGRIVGRLEARDWPGALALADELDRQVAGSLAGPALEEARQLAIHWRSQYL